MAQETSLENYQVGRGVVAGLSENVAERLARLAPVGPGRGARASVAGAKPARKRAGAKTTSSKDKKAMAPRKPATKASSKTRTAAKKPSAKKTAAKTRPKTNGKSKTSSSASPRSSSAKRGSANQDSTVFTEATPGGEQKTVAQMLGEVVWLMTQSPAHKTFFLSDLEWLAMVPIMLKQFRVFYATDKNSEAQGNAGASRPIGVVLWAHVDEDVEKRLEAGNAKLRPQDWRSGECLWVVDIIAPFGGHDEMLKDLKSQVFEDKTVKFRAIVDGKPSVREV